MGCAKKLLVAAGRHDELAKFQKFAVRHGGVMPNTARACVKTPGRMDG
jgi:hypothetical protein